ncbi:MAG TPA: hypothetical protein VFJ16_29170 [Longimicrobium sp.]|nr:hypothetical protein [Longimicrobium sp.]
MTFIFQLANSFARRLARLGVCGAAGFIVGTLAGFMLWLLDFLESGALSLSTPQAVRIAAILSLFGWLVLLFLLTTAGRALLSSVVVPTFVNAFLVCFLTVFLTRALGLYAIAWLVGMLAGVLIGYVLCTLYKRGR